MVELLDRGVREDAVDVLTSAQAAAPPKEMPDIERFVRPSWPRSAKIVTAVLGVLAVAGVFGTAVQYFDDDSAPDYQAQISDITEQRDALLVQNGNLRVDVNGLEADNAQLDADNTQLAADKAQLQAKSDAVSADLATVQAENSTMSTQLALATAEVKDLTNQVSGLQAANEAVTAERDVLVAMFPMAVEPSLEGVDVTGTYAAKWLPAYNSGLANIALPGVEQVVIGHTRQGWLQVTIPDVVTAALHQTDGALFTMVDTTTAVPPVDGVARMARVAITIYAGETVTAQDGTTTVTDLGMSIAVSTPAVEGAPEGVALYGVVLTPQA
jgi:hypothetical protein